MKHLCLFVFVLPLSGLASEPEIETEPKRAFWEVSLERSDSTGKPISRSKAHLSILDNQGAVRGQMMINMADHQENRFWTVNFEAAPTEGFVTYGIRDASLLQESLSNGDKYLIPVYMCDAKMPWKGHGRYPLMIFGEDRLILEFKHSSQSVESLRTHLAPMWIEMTKRSFDGKVIVRSSAPWFAIEGGNASVDLALPIDRVPDSSVGRVATTINLKEELVEGSSTSLSVRIRNWTLHSVDLRGCVTFDLMTPLKTNETMLVYELDREKVEAVIRPAEDVVRLFRSE